jgi:hypothetical protein
MISFSVFSSKTFPRTRPNFLQIMQINETTASQAFCYLNSNGTIYDLNPLYGKTADYNISGATYQVDFNVCKNALNKCGNKTSFFKYTAKVNGKLSDSCVSLAGPATVVSNWAVISKT